jgi:N-terminal acetyltransferase B complex non-catalytic subunit
LGWLSAFLKVYISVLQQASDLDDTVEEKLLVGDRPKQSNDPDSKLPWKERLSKQSQDELEELTLDELSFFNYVTALADWLEPYHNYTRPSPAAVLAEAAKQTSAKSSTKGVQLNPQNGSTTNGHTKKEMEAPPVKDAPEVIPKFFDDMNTRFKYILECKRPSSEALHVVTLTQEALILFAIETLRFKPASIVKVHKLGALVQSFKSIRGKAIGVLREMSAELLKISEQEGTVERRKAVVEACMPIMEYADIDHDFVLSIAKKITDARKKVHEGIAQGVTKLCTTYSNT